MKYRFAKLFVASLGLMGLSNGIANLTNASEDPSSPHIYAADSLPYATGLNSLETAVLFGDPAKEGPYVTRVKLRAGAVVPPHYHNDELKIATLIEGSIGVAYGEAYDEDALTWLKPGAVWTEPKGYAHFGKTGDNGAVLELHGIGPVSTIAVD